MVITSFVVSRDDLSEDLLLPCGGILLKALLHFGNTSDFFLFKLPDAGVCLVGFAFLYLPYLVLGAFLSIKYNLIFLGSCHFDSVQLVFFSLRQLVGRLFVNVQYGLDNVVHCHSPFV